VGGLPPSRDALRRDRAEAGEAGAQSDEGAGSSRPDLFQAALTDFDVTAIDDRQDIWRVFFHTATERDRAAVALGAEFHDLAIEAVDVPDDDWAARSQANLRAIQIGNIIVAPPWDAPVTIVVQPSMGFGTGHHATTRLCLAALQRLDLRGLTVIDAGTGSGVLAMAASLLGAARVDAFDDDADAVGAARENLERNPRARVTLTVGDLRAEAQARADLVLANLTGGLLVSAASQLQQLTESGGRLILSGFMTREERDVLQAFAPRQVEHRGQEQEWLCVILR
jgi:ribosomal protein L11 methyltransferase